MDTPQMTEIRLEHAGKYIGSYYKDQSGNIYTRKDDGSFERVPPTNQTGGGGRVP